uniref:Prolyl 4-hydroxylase alpha subunit domain-containing protein n=1 Tax=Mucochytrium quahogii TaxID=96639 RepID=A0A7S2SMZ4_9STRA|mmetsp:Transcript_8658/g.18993  ORF Transcript_8658/g.18993 Transcript_8658/m.18993 type:complete len:556 (+) Transcript_8658:2-1669(+)
MVQGTRTIEMYFVILFLVLLVGSHCEDECLDKWSPWDDGDTNVDLTPVGVSNSETVSNQFCLESIVVDDGDAKIKDVVKDFMPRMWKWESSEDIDDEEETLFVALNGMNTGIKVSIKNSKAKRECLGFLVQLAAETLTTPDGDLNSDIYGRKFMYSNTGRPITTWKDIQKSDFIIHVLFSGETWVWPGVEVGFEWKVSGVKLQTVALRPKIILAKDMVSEVDTEKLIESGNGVMERSPEKHYSDDPQFHNYRTSVTGNPSSSNPHVKNLRAHAQQVLRLPTQNYVEHLQLLKYHKADAWYKPHQDTFHHFKRFSKVDEDVYFYGFPRELAEWADQQRQILWWFSNTDDLSEERLESLGGRLFFRQEDECFPDLLNHRFVKATSDALKGAKLVDSAVVDVHIAWLKKCFCKQQNDVKQCVINAAEVLDSGYEVLQEEIGTLPEAVMRIRNRHVTMLPYLSSVEEGGETVFPYSTDKGLFGDASELVRPGMEACSKGIYVPPIKGAAAIFYHTTPDSREQDQLSTHGGCPPLKGTKWAMNIFCWNIDQHLGMKQLNE